MSLIPLMNDAQKPYRLGRVAATVTAHAWCHRDGGMGGLEGFLKSA